MHKQRKKSAFADQAAWGKCYWLRRYQRLTSLLFAYCRLQNIMFLRRHDFGILLGYHSSLCDEPQFIISAFIATTAKPTKKPGDTGNYTIAQESKSPLTWVVQPTQKFHRHNVGM